MERAFLQAISMLQAYLTDILPTTQPSLRVAVGNSAVNIPLTSQAKPRLVKITCRGQQKLGVEIQRVEESTVAGNFHPFFISRIEDGSVASTRLRVGDIVLESMIDHCQPHQQKFRSHLRSVSPSLQQALHPNP